LTLHGRYQPLPNCKLGLRHASESLNSGIVPRPLKIAVVSLPLHKSTLAKRQGVD